MTYNGVGIPSGPPRPGKPSGPPIPGKPSGPPNGTGPGIPNGKNGEPEDEEERRRFFSMINVEETTLPNGIGGTGSN